NKFALAETGCPISPPIVNGLRELLMRRPGGRLLIGKYALKRSSKSQRKKTKRGNAVASLLALARGGLGMSAPVQGGIGRYFPLVSRGLMLYAYPNGRSWHSQACFIAYK